MDFKRISKIFAQVFLYAICLSFIPEGLRIIFGDQDFKQSYSPLEKKFANLVWFNSQVQNITNIFVNHADKQCDSFVQQYLSKVKNYKIIIAKIDFNNIDVTQQDIQTAALDHKYDEIIEFSISEVADNMNQYSYFKNLNGLSINNIPYPELLDYLQKNNIYNEKIIFIKINNNIEKFQIKPVKKFICTDIDAAKSYLTLIAKKNNAKNQSNLEYSKEIDIRILDSNAQLFAELQGKTKDFTGFFEDGNSYIYYKIITEFPLNAFEQKKCKTALKKSYYMLCNEFFGIQIFPVS